MPRYWRYVKHGACHWLANFVLRLACLAEPKRAWRIVTSDKHSTVWDGARTLFEFNFQALGIDAQECWETVAVGGYELTPGAYMKVHYAQHWSNKAA
jgi:hypothetical protein